MSRPTPSLSPHAALRYTLRLSDENSPRYEEAVRHFIVLFIGEFKPKPLQIRRLSDCFECLRGRFLGEEARVGLEQSWPSRSATTKRAGGRGHRPRTSSSRGRSRGWIGTPDSESPRRGAEGWNPTGNTPVVSIGCRQRGESKEPKTA